MSEFDLKINLLGIKCSVLVKILTFQRKLAPHEIKSWESAILQGQNSNFQSVTQVPDFTNDLCFKS